MTQEKQPESGDRFAVNDNTFKAPVHFGSGRQINVYLKSTVAVIAAVVAAGVAVFAWQPWKATGTAAAVEHAQLRLVTPVRNAIVPKPVAGLGAPPAYPPGQKEDHCSLWWAHWLVQQGAADADWPPLIEISAPKTTAITVTGASIQVYKAYRPTAVTGIQCVYGAGPVPGTLLNVNLDRPNASPTIVSDAGQDVPLAMPYATISIDAGHTEYVAVTPAGTRGQFYEWSVKLTVVVDQHSQTYSFGTAARPLHSWMGQAPAHAYDYNTSTHSWQRVGG